MERGARKRWSLVGGAIAVFVLLLIGGYLYVNQLPTTNNGESPADTSAPSKTVLPENKEEQPKSYDYISSGGVVLRLDQQPDKQMLTSPYTLTGQVPGNWSFEASFPVELTDSQGKVLEKTPAHLNGNWMTTAYVPFSVTLTFTPLTTAESGVLILRKDNPSGMSENDDQVTINVRLAASH